MCDCKYIYMHTQMHKIASNGRVFFSNESEDTRQTRQTSRYATTLNILCTQGDINFGSNFFSVHSRSGKYVRYLNNLQFCGILHMPSWTCCSLNGDMMHLWRHSIHFNQMKQQTRTKRYVCTSNWLHATLLIIHYGDYDAIYGMLICRSTQNQLFNLIWMCACECMADSV